MSVAPSTSVVGSDSTDLRCAAQMRAAGADPIGTAGSQDGYLLVEWPRPWPEDLAAVGDLELVRAALAGQRIRLQGLVPKSTDSCRVVLYRRPEGPFSGYHRSELQVPLTAPWGPHDDEGPHPPAGLGDLGEALGRAAVELLAEPPIAPVRLVPDGDDPLAAATDAADRRLTDVLVCTHGRRDRCCGSWGTQLWHQLDADPSILGAGTRLWRTSHTGGHRYAATMILLPEGTMWGFVDPATAAQVVRRDGPVSEVLAGYRGCAGLPSPGVQALERAVLAEVGWALLDTPRVGADLAGGRCRLVLDPAGRAETWEATVTAGRTIPVPECGAPLDQAVKSSTEIEVSEVVRTC